MPTAEPTEARIKPQRLAKLFVFFVCFMVFSPWAVRIPTGRPASFRNHSKAPTRSGQDFVILKL